MKICKDCQHMFMGSESGPYCGSPQRPKDAHADALQRVYGGPLKLRWMYATEARHDDGLCGVDARWFERRRSWLERLRAAVTVSGDPE